MATCLGYIRLSQYEKLAVSIAEQDAAIRRLAEEEGYRLLAIHKDVGISGNSIKNRPALQIVLKAVTNKSINAVIVYSADRLSRNKSERLYMKQLFLDSGVKYLSCTGDILASGSIDNTLISLVHNIFKQKEREVNSSKAQRAIQRKKLRGERVGSQPRYGYRVVDRRLVEDPEEQLLLERIKELKEEGMSTYKITAVINDEGFRTRKQTLFSRTQIRRILTTLASPI